MTMPGIKAKRKQLVRKTLMRAKAQGERTAEQRQESPEEYAQTEVQQGISDVAARTGNTAKSTARMQMMTRLQRFADVGSLTSTCFLSIGVHAEHFTQQNK